MRILCYKNIVRSMAVTALTFVFLGCDNDFLDKQPLDEVSDATFWKTERDAMLALTGCYNVGGPWSGEDFWSGRGVMFLDLMAGYGSEKELIPDRMTDGTLNSAYWVPASYWSNTYSKIAKCNNFLDHIDGIPMDAARKAMIKAEVRTIRAYSFFNLALYYGNVPLPNHLLTLDEANSISQTPQEQVWEFAEQELSESAADLPSTRPDGESGRITSGAAMAIQGRVLMAEQKWSEAAATYKTIIDSGAYTIDQSGYAQLFWQSGELSKEIILSTQYQEDLYSNVLPQYVYPEAYGGWHQFSPYNELVKTFECIDGQTIEQSPLYDWTNPYENRDPRMDHNIMISDRTTFKGVTFVSRPDSSSPDRISRYNWSGYSINKFMDPSFDGNLMNYGGNFILIRYAEVLLSYLESKVEAGESIDQGLLDQTINMVRSRPTVGMPAVTTTNTAELRAKIRRERTTEFAFEGLHYFDILRWGNAAQELNRQFTGMKLTNDPNNYTQYPVDSQGYLIYQRRNFVAGRNELWPIPLPEMNINRNLVQNSGY